MRAEPTQEQVDRIARIARVLPMIAEDGQLGAPESDGVLDALEAANGRPLPPEVRAVYRVVGGGTSLLGGCLNLEPLLDDEFAVATHADQLREWDWSIPDEVVVFGGDGGGQVFGLWVPAGGALRHPVLRLDCGDEDGPIMGVVAQDLPAFLAAEIASQVFPWADDVGEEAQEALGLPPELVGDPDDRIPAEVGAYEAEHYSVDPLLRWASPEVPEVAYDIYRARTTVADVAAIAGRP
jgi:hypothetical protein